MKKRNWLILVVSGLMVVSLLLTACAEEPAPAPTAPTPAPTTPTPTPAPPPPEPIKLVFAETNPAGHPFCQADEAWMARIEEQTGGAVVFEFIPGSALITTPTAYVELSKGVCDAADFSCAYAPEGFDLEKVVLNMFYDSPSPEVTQRVYSEVRAQFPELDAEFSAVKLVGAAIMPTFVALTRDKPVSTVADFKGLSLKVSGKVYANFATALEAEGVSVPAQDTYVMLQKGTLDGGFFPIDTLETLRLAEVVKYATWSTLSNSPCLRRGMNLDSWNKLTPEIQKVIEDNYEWYSQKCDEMVGEAMDDAVGFSKEQGVEWLELSPEELSKFYGILDAVVVEEIAELDAKGFRGTEIYNEVRRLLKEYS